MHSHTQGPWHRNIKPATRYPTIFAGRNTHVAHVTTSGIPEAEVEANCDLIASAPELLRELEYAHAIIENIMGRFGPEVLRGFKTRSYERETVIVKAGGKE